MKSIYLKEKIKIITFVGLSLLLSTNLSCTSTGWSVGGYELSPSDTLISANFMIITCVNNLEHWYKEIVDESDNWCYLHTEWEFVRKQ